MYDNLKNARERNFRNVFDEETGERITDQIPVRVVFNNYYRSTDDGLVEEEIKRLVDAGVADEVILVRKDGSISKYSSH